MQHSTLNITTRNPLKFLAFNFLQFVDPLVIELKVGGKYKAQVEEYGHIGEIECAQVYKRHVFEIKPTEFLIAEGEFFNQQSLINQGFKRHSMIQIGVFKWLRRRDNQFKNIINTQCPKQGLELYNQKELFHEQ